MRLRPKSHPVRRLTAEEAFDGSRLSGPTRMRGRRDTANTKPRRDTARSPSSPRSWMPSQPLGQPPAHPPLALRVRRSASLLVTFTTYCCLVGVAAVLAMISTNRGRPAPLPGVWSSIRWGKAAAAFRSAPTPLRCSSSFIRGRQPATCRRLRRSRPAGVTWCSARTVPAAEQLRARPRTSRDAPIGPCR